MSYRCIVVAAILHLVNAFSSAVGGGDCVPLRDCSALPSGWASEKIVTKREYPSSKPASEVWERVIDHEAFYAYANMEVVQNGFAGKNDVGAVRDYFDTLGIGIHQIVYSAVAESHYGFRSFEICGPTAAGLAPVLGFCTGSVFMNQTATGWELTIESELASNDQAFLEETIIPPFAAGDLASLEAQDEYFA